MLDKEVGELWTRFVRGKGQQAYAHHQRYRDMVEILIRQLVVERALILEMKGWRQSETVRMARQSFGIPEEDW